MSYKKIIFILCLGIFLSAERNVSAQDVTAKYNFVDTVAQTWTVPCGVNAATVQLWSAGGGSGWYYNDYGEYAGGSGAYYKGVFTGLNAGDVVNLYVPSAGLYSSSQYSTFGGAGGWPGGGNGGSTFCVAGGGGGYAAISINGTYYVVVGAGGGGGGYAFISCYGGAGGATSGTNGGNGWNGGGQGATQLVGGAHGYNYNPCDSSHAGRFMTIRGGMKGSYGGGASCSGEYAGGGGGGGYEGGGGGGDATGGGGGGSSFPTSSFSKYGITFTVLTKTAGNSGNNESTYIAPGGPPAGIGSGGFLANGGNGYITVAYDTTGANSAVTVSATAAINETCNGENQGKAYATPVGAAGSYITYNWSPGGQTTDTIYNLTAGIYTVNVVSLCGSSASATVAITQPNFFFADVITTGPACNGGTADVQANLQGGTSPYTYLWAPGGSTASGLNGLTVGTYSLNAVDAKGCRTSSLITITQPAPIVATATETAAEICYGNNGGSAESSVTGGTAPYTYAWAPAGGTVANPSGLAAAIYTLTVTDAHGCTGTTTVAITQPAYLNVIVAPLHSIACNGDNNGVLGSGVTGGVRPYAYSWSNGAGSDSNAVGLSAGTYTLTVTDAHGCVTVIPGTITQPAPLSIQKDSTYDDGRCSGSAWLTISGGTTPYTYNWSNGSSNFYADKLCKGNSYCCVVTDANGCIVNTCVAIASSLGVASIVSSSNISVYPNPTNGQFTIESSVDGGQSLVEVYNVLGDKVYTTTLNAVKGGTNTIDISNQPNGVYVYRVVSSANGVLVGEGKIVLQK